MRSKAHLKSVEGGTGPLPVGLVAGSIQESTVGEVLPCHRPNSVDPLLARCEYQYRRPQDLTVYERELRKHPAKQLAKLEANIRAHGFVTPVLVDGDGVIISGHARLKVALKLGMSFIPTIRVEHLSKAQVRAFRLAENQLASLSEWNEEELVAELKEILELEDVAALGWETGELDLLLEERCQNGSSSSEDPADLIPTTPRNPVTLKGDIWCLGKHRLACASSLAADDWATLMAGAQARMAFTDPPYNVPIAGHVSGLGKHQHDEFEMASGEMSEDEFIAFNERYLHRLVECLAPGAILCVCMDWKHLWELQSGARAAGLQLINLCVWNKQNGGMGALYRSKHELVLIFKHGKAPHQNNVQLGRFGRYRTNVWEGYPSMNSFGSGRDEALAMHPTVKPTALVADAIRDVSKPGDIVLDAFIGSGTTIVAAERTKRICYGMEIAPKYVDVAIARWAKMTGEPAILEATGETFAEVAARRVDEVQSAPAYDPDDVRPPLRRRLAA
jgi:DNA modification methylase